MNSVTTTGRELWDALCERGAVEPKGRDKELVKILVGKLGLQVGKPIAEELDAHSASADDVARVVLSAAQPFVEMWSDLLAMFERAAATRGRDSLNIVYDFGKDQPTIRFDLDHFRVAIRRFQRARAQFDLSSAETGDFWKLMDAIRHDNWHQTTNQDVESFALACIEGTWPAALPVRPHAPHHELDPLLEELWDLANEFLTALREVSSSYAELDTQRPEIQPSATTSEGLRVQVMADVASDLWLPNLVRSATNRLAEADTDWDATATALDSALATFRNRDPNRTSIQETIENLLSLPIWKFRYDLFSNWVCTQVLDALADQRPLIHTTDNTILFSFGGTHLATFEAFDPPLHLWCELRSPLGAKPSKVRTTGIQPDITLVADPIEDIDKAPIAIECKQYAKPNNKKFGEALTDYASGRPASLVILASYGRVKEATVHKYVPPDLRDRTRVVGDLIPNSPAAHELRESVRTRLGLDLRSTTRTITTPAAMTLRWNAVPRDLDIAVVVVAHDGREATVDFNHRGALDRFPYCQLANDCTSGHGPETVHVAQVVDAIYRIEIRRYSDDGNLNQSAAELTITWPDDELVLTCPADIDSRIWVAAQIIDRVLIASPLDLPEYGSR